MTGKEKPQPAPQPTPKPTPPPLREFKEGEIPKKEVVSIAAERVVGNRGPVD